MSPPSQPTSLSGGPNLPWRHQCLRPRCCWVHWTFHPILWYNQQIQVDTTWLTASSWNLTKWWIKGWVVGRLVKGEAQVWVCIYWIHTVYICLCSVSTSMCIHDVWCIYVYIWLRIFRHKWRFVWSVHMYIYQRFTKGGHVCTYLDL